MDKQTWLVNRARILSGSLNDEDLQNFYNIFIEKCSEDYKKTDFVTFKTSFTQWFAKPLSMKGNVQVVTPQNTIVHNMIRYFDLKYNVVYLYDKDKNLIKIF